MSSQISIKESMFDNYNIYIYISYLNDNEHEDDNNNDGDDNNDDIKKVWRWLIDGCYIDLIKYIQ